MHDLEAFGEMVDDSLTELMDAAKQRRASNGRAKPKPTAKRKPRPRSRRSRRPLPDAGSPGVFRATFDVPAGGYEYKVALNGLWDENYGAGGSPGGANIALHSVGDPITFTYDHATHVIADDTPKKPAASRAPIGCGAA